VNSKLKDFAFVLTGGIEMKQSIQLNTLWVNGLKV